jgi:hypothetical protein|nr:hypothetical protein [Kofleriaceae bacterium]
MRVRHFAILLAACGGSSAASGADAGGGSGSAGTGTGTLVVTGSLDATPQVGNASDPASFTVDIAVRLQRAGSDVTAGTVTVASSGGSVDLVYDPASARWHGAQAGYAASYTLDVAAGSDTITGVTVDGPAIHTVTAPIAGVTVDSTMALAVAWAPASAGDQAAISTRDLHAVDITDTGSYTLAAGTLRSKPDQVENDDIQIARSRSVVPAGAAPGSLVAVIVENGIDVVIQPTGSGSN